MFSKGCCCNNTATSLTALLHSWHNGVEQKTIICHQVSDVMPLRLRYISCQANTDTTAAVYFQTDFCSVFTFWDIGYNWFPTPGMKTQHKLFLRISPTQNTLLQHCWKWIHVFCIRIYFSVWLFSAEPTEWTCIVYFIVNFNHVLFSVVSHLLLHPWPVDNMSPYAATVFPCQTHVFCCSCAPWPENIVARRSYFHAWGILWIYMAQ